MEQLDAIIVGAGFGGWARRSSSTSWATTGSPSSTARTISAEPGTSTTTRADGRRPVDDLLYWFELNPYWSRLYAPGVELKRYADHVADKYNLRRYMRFDTTIDGARWDDDANVWVVSWPVARRSRRGS